MIEEGALKLLQTTAVEAAGKTVVVGDLAYIAEGFKRIEKPLPNPLIVRTLQGLVDYVTTAPDGDQGMPAAVHVVDHNEVHLIRALDKHQRAVLLIAKREPLKLPLEEFASAESLIIGLQALFVETPSRVELLKVLGNIKSELAQTNEDDGVTQTVTARSGIVIRSNVPMPNPVDLKPFRTFTEVDQPESPFVVRVKDGPTIGLFCADGGAWKVRAIEAIAAWLREKLPGVKLIA